ncbi:pregnancy zone protein-like isoform X2 [Maniola jurtina]|uniref:pregnancy zone protein-like isoform X2 n=1 Tax=Maniola jurtina TaxID=191418 RepID=UPI001E68AB0C|nr:pregnancy zone protein-like isoform X2 [Maniola jurtina]
MSWIIALFIIPTQAQFFETPQNITSSPCTDRNHMFLAPGVLTAGGNSRACISRFHTDGPAHFHLTLGTDDGGTVSASRDLIPGDGGCLDISVPLRPNTKAELNVNIRYPEANCAWDRGITVRIASGRVVIVHTERGRYHPGDTVRFRAVALKADLTPAHTTIEEVWLEGPRGAWDGVKTAQWQRVRTRLGLMQLQHQLDELVPPGKWTIRARLADGSQGSTSFSVGNYELPPFQLTVRHAPIVLRTSERLVWTVCVRYPWSEAVEGMLVIRLRGAGGSGQGQGGIRTAVRLKAPRACHRHAAATKRIGLDGTSPPDVIVADFSFQEEGTRIWQNTTVISQVVDDPVKLEFLTKHRAVISPGLPYKIKVKASRWDDKPAVNERVSVCRSTAITPEESSFNAAKASCVDSITDAKGIGRVMFTADDNGKPYYHFQARLYNATAHLVTRCSTTQGRAALGALRTDSRARTLLPLYLNLGHLTAPITVHFVVITRGGIIYRWGATTQCPITSITDQIHTTDRNSICSNRNFQKLILPNKILEGRNSSELDSLLDRHLSKVMLPIKVSNQMCPDSHLIAYFYYNNELITASKHFEMEECFANKVEAAWTTRQTLPGSVASLQISTPGPALCALTVLDTASKWVQPPESVKNLMMLGLRKLIDGHRNITEHDAAGECFLTSDTLDLPSSSIELMSTWLASAGVRIFGGNSPRKHCSVVPAALMADDDNAPRKDFSESWLWRLAAIGTNDSVTVSAHAPDSITRFEASAFCLAKNGVSVSQPAILQVFREFFIHADGPRRLKRGDTAIIPYRIFNYLYQAISIKIQISTDSRLNSSTNAETVCIQPRSSVAKRLEVSAKQNGAGRLRIKASTVRDYRCTNNTSGKDVSDEVVIRIDVDPEGVPTQEYKSAMICAKDIYSLKNEPVVWKWSQIKAVPGTEYVTVWAAGNTIAPLLADADALVQLPRGCGEQNMARLATNLLALTFLEPTSTPAIIAKDHVARGFTRQLQYVHPSGGFSAFGASDAAASTWLTAFCVRYLRKAYRVISGEAAVPPVILQAEQWLKAQQMENGCFRNQGHVFHHELKGGLNEDGEISSVALTAYVITSLLETSPLSSKLLKNTLSCLRALPPSKSKSKVNPLRIYAHSIVTYSLMRLRRYEEDLKSANEAFLRVRSDAGLEQDEELRELLELLRMAKRTEDYVWWETGNLATSVEATGYALLALSECPPALRDNCAADVAGATRWLATHRNAAGGFISTQDTLVTLEGLSRWTTLLPSINNLTVTIRSGAHRKELRLNTAVKLPELAKIPVTDQLKISVEGSGCALVQATRFYNTLSEEAAKHNTLSVQVDVQTDGAFNCDNNTVCFCAATVEVCVLWVGPFPEMALLEVGLPGGFGADAAALYSHLQRNDTLLRRIELSPTSGKATLYLGTRDGSDTISRAGHQCYKIHAVGPKARTKPAHAKVLDYYRPHIKDTQMYTIPEDCPSRIVHDTSNYHASDNLFNKAKSLTDSEEILITHEFSFEDIPEGIPLEDPLYDNLTKRNQNEDSEKHKNFKNQLLNSENNNRNNNIIDGARLNKNIRDENEIPTENEYITNTSVVVTDSVTINSDDTNFTINRTNINANINTKDENEVSREDEYLTNFSAVVTNSSITKNRESDSKNNEVHKDSNLYNGSSVKNENDILKENEYIANTSTETNNVNDHEKDKLMNGGYNKDTTNQWENLVTKEINTTIDIQNESKISNEVIRDTTSEIQDYNKNDVKGELILHNTEEKLAVDNPLLNDFHVIDSHKDLDVPTGIEGPIPAIVLPPKNFVPPPDIVFPINTHSTWRRFPEVPYNPYYYQPPYYYKQNYYINHKPVWPTDD